jgi:hypothetical protein
MKKLLKIVKQWLDNYEDDVTFIQRMLRENQQKRS